MIYRIDRSYKGEKMKQIKVGSILFLGGLLGTLTLFFIASNKINSLLLLPLSTGIPPNPLVPHDLDLSILDSLISMGLKVPVFMFLAIMFLGFYFLLSGLENKA